ncbi:ABC transporter substrate-binding protein [Kitasatospora azatica]|uniref:ABC transporter substrate-binding protein n=1 Tax=Kitasatospora azatica TaxID=58347 RepID=UPI00056BA828|nr:iron-siderophore ABC transporter substrate-binding protein [Kitasatospora azatica]
MHRRTVLTTALAAALTGCGRAPGIGEPLPDVTAPVPSATVTAANGPVVVPGEPVRVVALDTAELDSAMTLGITPVGACRPAADHELPGYWPASRLTAVATAGSVGAPHYEQIRALRPELILGNQTRDGAHYDALRAIAPTVLTPTTGFPWRENFLVHARALGSQSAADAVAGAYRGQLATVSRALAGAGATGRRVSLVRFVQGGRIRLYGRQNFLGTILADLQLGRPDAQNVDQFDVEVNPDQLGGADGDLLLYSTYGDPGAAGTDAVLAGPAWRALGAVRAHRAFPVDDQLWFEGIGYTGANLILTQLQCLLGA